MKHIRLVCSECGKEFEKPCNEYNRRIRLGVEKFYCSISCGALYSNRISPRKGDIKNFGDKISIRQKDILSPFRWYMRRAYNRRYKQGDTNLTPQFLQEIWNDQNGICPISGWYLILPAGTAGWINDNKLSPHSASLDRINNSLGYIKGNVRFVAVMANYARNTFTDEEVIEFGKAVAEYNKSK